MESTLSHMRSDQQSESTGLPTKAPNGIKLALRHLHGTPGASDGAYQVHQQRWQSAPGASCASLWILLSEFPTIVGCVHGESCGDAAAQTQRPRQRMPQCQRTHSALAPELARAPSLL